MSDCSASFPFANAVTASCTVPDAPAYTRMPMPTRVSRSISETSFASTACTPRPASSERHGAATGREEDLDARIAPQVYDGEVRAPVEPGAYRCAEPGVAR